MQTALRKIYITIEPGNMPYLNAATSDTIGSRPVDWGDLPPLYQNIAHHLTDTPTRHDSIMHNSSNIHIAKQGKDYILTCQDDGNKLTLNKSDLLSLFLDIIHVLNNEPKEAKAYNHSLPSSLNQPQFNKE